MIAEVKKHNLLRFLVMANRNFISAITQAVHEFYARAVIYALVQSTWNHESNERNRWFRLDAESFVYLCAFLSHAHLARKPISTRLSWDRARDYVARYWHTLHARSTSFRIFVRPATGSAVTPRMAQADRLAIVEFPGENFPRESERSERGLEPSHPCN